MSNDYTMTTFAFSVTKSEADLLQEALRALSIINGPEIGDLSPEWDGMSEAFRNAFANPADGRSANFDEFLSIFVDPCLPSFDTEFTFDEQADDTVLVTGDSEQFAFEPVANLFARTIKESLPIVVTWAETCSKAVPGAFGGGAFRISAEGTTWFHTHELHYKPDAHAEAPPA